MFLNAFSMNCVVHQSPGLWIRPEDKMVDYKDLNTWVGLAKLLEREKVTDLFLQTKGEKGKGDRFIFTARAGL